MSNRELRACGRHGHITYAPVEAGLAERLRGNTALGEAWRCLRCGDWVLGTAGSSGPADQAPVPARGRALRQLTILRLLAVERVLRALVLIAAAYGVHRFASAQLSLRGSFGRLLPAARPLADRLGVDLDQSTIVATATKVGAFVINIAAVVYLVVAKRLFGARGQAAYERELQGESLLEVTAAGEEKGYGRRREAGRDVGMSEVAPDAAERPTGAG